MADDNIAFCKLKIKFASKFNKIVFVNEKLLYENYFTAWSDKIKPSNNALLSCFIDKLIRSVQTNANIYISFDLRYEMGLLDFTNDDVNSFFNDFVSF